MMSLKAIYQTFHAPSGATRFYACTCFLWTFDLYSSLTVHSWVRPFISLMFLFYHAIPEQLICFIVCFKDLSPPFNCPMFEVFTCFVLGFFFSYLYSSHIAAQWFRSFWPGRSRIATRSAAWSELTPVCHRVLQLRFACLHYQWPLTSYTEGSRLNTCWSGAWKYFMATCLQVTQVLNLCVDVSLAGF